MISVNPNIDKYQFETRNPEGMHAKEMDWKQL